MSHDDHDDALKDKDEQIQSLSEHTHQLDGTIRALEKENRAAKLEVEGLSNIRFHLRESLRRLEREKQESEMVLASRLEERTRRFREMHRRAQRAEGELQGLKSRHASRRAMIFQRETARMNKRWWRAAKRALSKATESAASFRAWAVQQLGEAWREADGQKARAEHYAGLWRAAKRALSKVVAERDAAADSYVRAAVYNDVAAHRVERAEMLRLQTAEKLEQVRGWWLSGERPYIEPDTSTCGHDAPFRAFTRDSGHACQ